MNVIRLSQSTDIFPLMNHIDVTKEGQKILDKKSKVIKLWIQNLRTPAANILKQDALSIGADLVVPARTIICEGEFVDAILLATPSQLKTLLKKEKSQPFGLKKLSDLLKPFLEENFHDDIKIMGIVNATTDSFYEKSRFMKDDAISKINSMIEDGARIIDLGALSTRPGSKAVSPREELDRLKPIIDIIYKEKLYSKVRFSLDSYTFDCVEYALDHGFDFINDITGLSDPNVARLVSKYNGAICIMHMQGSPLDMQLNPVYENVISEVDNFFKERIELATSFGIKEIYLDVGIGFGKNLQHNLLLIKHHAHFLHFGYELLIGASRKSLINSVYPSQVEQRLPGTLALHLEAIKEGASIVRVHDVKEHFQAIAMQQAIWKAHEF